jgi:hypothetical protein
MCIFKVWKIWQCEPANLETWIWKLGNVDLLTWNQKLNKCAPKSLATYNCKLEKLGNVCL